MAAVFSVRLLESAGNAKASERNASAAVYSSALCDGIDHVAVNDAVSERKPIRIWFSRGILPGWKSWRIARRGQQENWAVNNPTSRRLCDASHLIWAWVPGWTSKVLELLGEP